MQSGRTFRRIKNLVDVFCNLFLRLVILQKEDSVRTLHLQKMQWRSLFCKSEDAQPPLRGFGYEGRRIRTPVGIYHQVLSLARLTAPASPRIINKINSPIKGYRNLRFVQGYLLILEFPLNFDYVKKPTLISSWRFQKLVNHKNLTEARFYELIELNCDS